MRNNKALTHARHDPGHVLAHGLFRSLASGDYRRLKLDVAYEIGNERLEFGAKEPLGADEMRVLQGLIALAGPKGLILKSDTPSSDARQLFLDLFAPASEFAAATDQPESIVVRESFRRLAREIGMNESGPNITRIRQAIERLFAVTVFIQSGRRRVGCRLLSSYASDEGVGDLYVALNPRLTEAILGHGQHVRIDMEEVRGLRSDPARLMHQRLSGWINPGMRRRVSVETLCSYVWPDAASDQAMRKRRQRVRSALTELRRVGWFVEEQEGVVMLGRPKLRSIGHGTA